MRPRWRRIPTSLQKHWRNKSIKNKQNQTLKGRNSSCHGNTASSYKSKKEMSRSFPYPLNHSVKFFFSFTHYSGYTRNPPSILGMHYRDTQMEETYIVDTHDHPTWQSNLILSTLVSNDCQTAVMGQTLSLPKGVWKGLQSVRSQSKH